jgi:hypothetical protein
LSEQTHFHGYSSLQELFQRLSVGLVLSVLRSVGQEFLEGVALIRYRQARC